MRLCFSTALIYKRRMRRPAFVLAILLLLLAVAWATGALEGLGEPEAIRQQVAAAGIWGPLVFIGVAAALFAVFMLAPPVWAAATLWPLPVAFAYSLIAALMASMTTYLLTRRLGRAWARDRIPASIQLWEQRLESRPLLTVLLLRQLLWANPLVDMLVAVTKIPVRTYMTGTLVGLVPPTAFHVLVGAGGLELAGRLPWWGWVAVASLVSAAIIIFRRTARSRASAAPR
jgi:uncharacterized membrane protein YdjX (TVP38/TMEM64 family)